ncbi:MAG: glycine--tRNA ligase subunit beta, partial [Proteobacteria bacterium]|nr:glycine--tRNA ligase subunit beta [Pseudomonadota bacterium]
RSTQVYQAGQATPIELAHAADYYTAMASHGQSTAISFPAYANTLKQQIHEMAQTAGGTAILGTPLLNQIAAITTTPLCLACQFDEKFLELPAELISHVLEHHQRCVSLSQEDGTLSRTFLCVTDCRQGNPDYIRTGNQRVVSARLEDAMYFWQQDKARTLEQWRQSLDNKEWFEGLGTHQLRIKRLSRLAKLLARHHNIAAAPLLSAVELCKIDLTSAVVNEYPELEGITAAHLLSRLGIAEEVTAAISTHTKPRSAQEDIPTTTLPRLCALADRLDTLVGLYTRHRAKSSDADPFGIRRVCVAIIRLSLAPGVGVDGGVDGGVDAVAGVGATTDARADGRTGGRHDASASKTSGGAGDTDATTDIGTDGQTAEQHDASASKTSGGAGGT